MEESLPPWSAARLADAIALLEQPARRTGLLTALETAARRLAACHRVVLIGSPQDELSEEEFRPLYLSDSSRLNAALLPLCKPEYLPQPGETNLVTSPSPVLPPADSEAATVLLAGTHAEAGCSAIAFIWQHSYDCDAETTAALRALAMAASLALRSERNARELRLNRNGLQRHIGELQHRLRNVLAFVRSIVRRTMQSAESPEEFALHLEARIGSLSRVQAALNSAGTEGVEMQDLLRTELTANAVREEQFEVSGPSVRLRARGAETLGLAFHELVTNSLKFGAFGTAGSTAGISWDIDTTAHGGWLRFRWLEKQASALATGAPRRGFGRELIEHTLPYEFEAVTRFELSSTGLLCCIDVPLNARTANSILVRRRVTASGNVE